jgi:nucleoside-diphosphate kinase
METTLIIIKPDAVQRSLIGAIIARFEQKGFQVVGAKMLRITPELAAAHYKDHVGKPFYPSLQQFITSRPVIALAVRGQGVIDSSRKLIGATDGLKAEPGTIRGDYGVSKSLNLIHGSDSPEAAARELKLFFRDDELLSYDAPNAPWLYG